MQSDPLERLQAMLAGHRHYAVLRVFPGEPKYLLQVFNERSRPIAGRSGNDSLEVIGEICGDLAAITLDAASAALGKEKTDAE